MHIKVAYVRSSHFESSFFVCFLYSWEPGIAFGYSWDRASLQEREISSFFEATVAVFIWFPVSIFQWYPLYYMHNAKLLVSCIHTSPIHLYVYNSSV